MSGLVWTTLLDVIVNDVPDNDVQKGGPYQAGQRELMYLGNIHGQPLLDSEASSHCQLTYLFRSGPCPSEVFLHVTCNQTASYVDTALKIGMPSMPMHYRQTERCWSILFITIQGMHTGSKTNDRQHQHGSPQS